jgi:hypothetical protein
MKGGGLKRVSALMAALLLTACGATGIGGGGNASPSPSDGDRFDVTATEADHAITIHAGQTLELVLHRQNGLNNWSHPSSSDESLLMPIVDPAATAARGVTLAAFRAEKPGSVDVTATASPVCPSGGMCPMYVALYSLRVTVTA